MKDSAARTARADAGMTWTKERIELLTKLWTEGLSASQIAAELGEGVSRNAVLGKAHRLGLAQGERKVASSPRSRKPTRPPDPPPVVELTPPDQPVPAEPPPQNNPVLAPMTPNQPSAEAAELRRRDEAVVPRLEGVTIMELREGVCRWPLGDPTSPDFRYCGARAVEGLPYCAHHAQLAYQPATERKRLRA
jgi:GcrA cell cycle regulator